MVALCDALRGSTVCKLQTLDVRENAIGPDGAKALAAFCAASGSLTACDARGNHLGSELKAALREAVEGRSGFELRV